MITSHFNAMMARLQADTALAGKGHDAFVVNADGSLSYGPYFILLGGGPDVLDDDRLSAPQSPTSDAEFTYTVRYVASSPTNVRSGMGKVYPQLIGHRLIVSGRLCTAIALERSTDIRADTTVSPPLYYADVEVSFKSSRA